MPNKQSRELRGCPFCGGEAELIARANGNFDVGCNNPLCYGWACSDNSCSCEDGYLDREEAITAWNTRQPDERVAEMRETLRVAGDMLEMCAEPLQVPDTVWKPMARRQIAKIKAALEEEA